MMKEFQAVFQISKTIIFKVRYYTLLSNTTPHFSTSAAQFCRNKRDYSQCGQAQKSLLPPCSAAMRFFKKWDAYHLKSLTQTQYDEMRADLEELKAKYNYLYEELDENQRPYNPSFGFYRLAEWSKQNPKKKPVVSQTVKPTRRRSCGNAQEVIAV